MFHSRAAIGIWAVWLPARVLSQVITITEYPASCTARYTTEFSSVTIGPSSGISSPSPSESPEPLTDDSLNAGENAFLLQIPSDEPGPTKRQADGPTYIARGGYTTTNVSEAVEYIIRNGTLGSTQGGFISTDTEIDSMPFALSEYQRAISTMFFFENLVLNWNNTAFEDGAADFYRVTRDNSSQQIVVRFRGAVDPGWDAVVFAATPTDGVVVEPLPGTSTTPATAATTVSLGSPVSSGQQGGTTAGADPSALPPGSGGEPPSPNDPNVNPSQSSGMVSWSTASSVATSSQASSGVAISSTAVSSIDLSSVPVSVVNSQSSSSASSMASASPQTSLSVSSSDSVSVTYTQTLTPVTSGSTPASSQSVSFSRGQPIGPNQPSLILSGGSTIPFSSTASLSSSTPRSSAAGTSISVETTSSQSVGGPPGSMSSGRPTRSPNNPDMESLPAITYESTASSSSAPASSIFVSTSLTSSGLSKSTARSSTPSSMTTSSMLSSSRPLSSSSASRPISSSSSSTASSSMTSAAPSSVPRSTTSSSTASSSAPAVSSSSPSSSASSDSSPASSSARSSSISRSSLPSSSSSPSSSSVTPSSTRSSSSSPLSPTTTTTTTTTRASSSSSRITSSSSIGRASSSSSSSRIPSSSSAYLVLPSPTPCNFGDPPSYPEDDAYCRITAPQPLSLYTTSSTQTFASTNGFISLNYGSDEYQALQLPTQQLPDATVAPFFADLFLDGTARPRQGIFYQSTATGVTYEYYLGRKGAPATEIYHFTVGYEYARAGVWTFRYLQVGSGNNGDLASVGMQGVNATGATGYSLSYQQAVITPGLVIVCDSGANVCTRGSGATPY